MLEQSPEKRKELKKMFDEQRGAGRRGGGRSWPVWVVQLITELLAHGTPPSAILANIDTMYKTLYEVTKPKEVPSVNFVRECRVVVQVLGETITAVKLASAEKWDQLWADATSRRQTSFQALIIGIMGEDDKIRSCCCVILYIRRGWEIRDAGGECSCKSKRVHVIYYCFLIATDVNIFFRLILLNIGLLAYLK